MSEQQGWVKVWRKIQGNGLWLSEPFTRAQAWVDMIMLANHKPGIVRVRGVRVDIRRGQLGWSQPKLAERWQWSRGKVARFLDELETIQQIVQQKNRITTVITIVNYEQYQGDDTTSDTTNGQQTGANKNANNEKKKRIKENKQKKRLSEVDLNRFDWPEVKAFVLATFPNNRTIHRALQLAAASGKPASEVVHCVGLCCQYAAQADNPGGAFMSEFKRHFDYPKPRA